MQDKLLDSNLNWADAERNAQTDRDAALKHLVGGTYRPTSPRNAFEKANEYVPTRVRAALVAG
jgi:hypothetical protein